MLKISKGRNFRDLLSIIVDKIQTKMKENWRVEQLIFLLGNVHIYKRIISGFATNWNFQLYYRVNSEIKSARDNI